MAQGFLGIPIDFRTKSLVTGLFMGANDAHAPTLYQYDSQGYMRPAQDRTLPLSTEEQSWMDAYNRQHTITINNWNESLDRFFLAPLYMPEHFFPLLTTGNDVWQCLRSIQLKTQSASLIPSPIVLDLDGDGVETISVSDGAWFDHAADGFAERTGWAGSEDGLLVRDIDGNGFINFGRELFGSETLLPNGTKAANGFEALKAFDANTDGVINAQDAAFAELRVWKDANTNSRTDAGELLTLAEAGVASVNVAYANSSHIDAQGNAHRQVGSYTTASGETRTATDIWVQTNTTQSLSNDWVDVSEDIAALPDAQGYWLVRDLHQAMAMDATGELKALVEAFTQATTPQDRDYVVTQLVSHWADVQDIDPASRASRMIYGNATGDTSKLKSSDNDMDWIAGNLNSRQSTTKYRKPQTIIKTQEVKSFHH